MGEAMKQHTLQIGAACGALLLALFAGNPAHASKVDSSDNRSAIRPNAKCIAANAKVTVVVKGTTLRCKKGKGGFFWRVVKTAGNQGPSAPTLGPVQRLSVVPQGGNNALFTMNQRFGPELGQTVTLSQPIALESLTLDPRCITRVPLNYYSGQNQDHSLEQFTCNYPDIETTLTTSIYRISDQFTQNPSRFFVSELTPVYKATSKQTMRLEAPFTVMLSPAVRLDPGYYAITFGFELTDPNINTIWFGGHNHNEGPQPACVRNPTSDIYTQGSAYRGEPNNTYTGLADNFRGFANMFLMHTSKVQSCIVVGNFTDDVFVNGDLNLVLQYREFSR